MPWALRDGAVGEYVEHQAERGDLRRDPAQVGQGDGNAGDDFDLAVIALSVEIADGQQVHAVELAREEQAEQDQAQRSAEGVGDQSAEIAFHEGGRDAQYRFGAEPSGEHHGQDDVQGQRAAGSDVVLGVVYLGGGVKTDAQGDDQIQDDEAQQHGWLPGISNAVNDSRACPKICADGGGSVRHGAGLILIRMIVRRLKPITLRTR
jgi:hypothetical protein